MTLVDQIIQILCAQFYSTSSVRYIVCSPTQVTSPFITIYPPNTVLLLPHSPYSCPCPWVLSLFSPLNLSIPLSLTNCQFLSMNLLDSTILKDDIILTHRDHSCAALTYLSSRHDVKSWKEFHNHTTKASGHFSLVLMVIVVIVARVVILLIMSFDL